MNNPYLGLDGSGVIVGIVDTGIDYLNKEFMREDDTSRILTIWDQKSTKKPNDSVYVGSIFTNEDINNAIKSKADGRNPYDIVDSRDEIGHGTKLASIVGARGYNRTIKGIAPNCDFAIVKLLTSLNYEKAFKENGIENVPVYNETEIIAGIEYLKNYASSVKRPLVICLAIGCTEASHDGRGLFSRYLTTIGSIRGVAVVAGVGNEGSSQGHASGFIELENSIEKVELLIPREIKNFNLAFWIQRPNIVSLNIISPSGEESSFIDAKISLERSFKFILTDTSININYYVPDTFTGNELIFIDFKDIKPGIWTFQLRGDYITNGRYDVWLAPSSLLPENTKFLRPNPLNTLMVPSTARYIISVAYYNSKTQSLLAESGKGFNINGWINPDITTAGKDVLTIFPGNRVGRMSGSSPATAIIVGVCALLFQWGIINGNDRTMNSSKLRSYLIYGATRVQGQTYPNESTGYGYLDLYEIFKNIIAVPLAPYRSTQVHEDYTEYYCGRMLVSVPSEFYCYGGE
ncbi:S8 family peptidase [Clostridium perfringens]|uniref:Putative protease CspA n=1 Tax=Clostridium perfringens TaxID=1502 RepID=A0A133NCL8_CLOPF|nr:S8 family peptidase [Clostridium perfringens]KXA14007.1 putative protease CspA [Clostridium perfringens]MCH1963746.1 S8 family peptidase [Clostridium perfringens]MDK0569462.1 S8 family peptidase [Clostridium perfringens]MDM0460485.1 S8 family peptidase [Clostridium perfringens]MDM0467811.1 S8 family peptidase [Clostridium perfringens]